MKYSTTELSFGLAIGIIIGIIIGYAIGMIINNEAVPSERKKENNFFMLCLAGSFVLSIAVFLIKIFVFPVLISLMSD